MKIPFLDRFKENQSNIKFYENPSGGRRVVEVSLNVMAHVQKPDFVFRRNGRVHLIGRWASVQSTTGSRVVRMSNSNARYTMFRGSVKGTGYPLHSPVFPFTSPPVRHRVPSHFNWGLRSTVTMGYRYVCWRSRDADLGHTL